MGNLFQKPGMNRENGPWRLDQRIAICLYGIFWTWLGQARLS